MLHIPRRLSLYAAAAASKTIGHWGKGTKREVFVLVTS
jgi:hypothetical protein